MYNIYTMRNNNIDLSYLRAVAKDAEQEGIMICLSAHTLSTLLDKVEDSEAQSIHKLSVSEIVASSQN